MTTRKLVPINPPLRSGQVVFCCECGGKVTPPQVGYADLNGPSFQAYLCDDCAKKVTS